MKAEISKADMKLSKKMSHALRHDPAHHGLSLDKEGWCDVSALQKAVECDSETLGRIVRDDDKGRYEFSWDCEYIRATHGHSVDVDVNPTLVDPPPEMLYHGTATRFLDSIREQGILPMKRRYVHLAADFGTAVEVGARHGKPVVLLVPALALSDRIGQKFYLSASHIWLTDTIEPRHLWLAAPFVTS